MKAEKRLEFYKALQIGFACVGTYVASYYMRNLLSVASPQMLDTGLFTKEILGTLSSVYMLFYAIGQLLNGVIGDIVKPKKMVFLGLAFSGIASIAFAFSKGTVLQTAIFAVIGFSLSMLRGPLVKTISENTSSSHSRVICTFLSFASFSGPLIASLISMIFNWQKTFIFAGITAIIIAVVIYIVFTFFENNGKISYTFQTKSGGYKNIFKVFTLKHFVFYLFVGGIAEISSTSINFWLPTYFTEYLSLSENTAKIIFSAKSIITCIVPFATLIIFRLFANKDIKLVRYSFLFTTLFYFGMTFFSNPILNVACVILAQISIGIASALLWSVYIPAQRDSGMVSTVNGVLDFTGYLFASIANMLFAQLVTPLGWSGIIILWSTLSLLGFVMAVFTKQEK